MNPKILTFILILTFFNLTLNSKHSHHTTHTQQLQQVSTQHSQHSHKSHKKARIAEKQKFQIKDFITSLNQFASSIADFFTRIFDYFTLKKKQKIQKQSVVYRENFASQNGGAQILMVSSSKIKSAKAILKSNPDAYLFTADVLPITIVIGLKEEILIDSFVIQSGQIYSCIVQDFKLEGAFTLQNQEWILLGNFTAQNTFEAQQFAVQQKIIRYLKLTILSSYGKWKYFTLTQIEVFGQGLFSHAMQSLLQADYNLQKNRTIEQNLEKDGKQGKINKDKFADKQIHTKQILVEVFTEVVEEQKAERAAQKHKKEHLVSSPQSQQIKFNDSQRNEKSNTKDKKWISNLKKKVNYLEKRNYELHQQIKELKKVTGQRITQLQTKQGEKQIHRDHAHNSGWYEFLFEFHWIIYLSTLINIVCLVLVGLVFKNKIFSKDRRWSVSVNEIENKKDSEGKKKQEDKQQKLKLN